MQRRTFLKTTGLLTTSTLLANPENLYTEAQTLPKNGSVLILGAGFAGLSAAYMLHEKNIKFTILEARNRIGGRVFTNFLASGLHTELGAEWIGASHTNLINACQEMNLKLIDHRFEGHLTLNGVYQTPQNILKDAGWEKKIQDLYKNFSRLSKNEAIKLDKTDWWRYLINQGISEEALEIRELNDSTDFGETIRNVSAYAALSEYAGSSPNNEMDFKIEGGNGRLAQAISQKIGTDKILLNKKAVSVIQTKQNVEITCEDGSKYITDRLICAIPAFAVSKINWNPVFPTEKQEAIQQLQYARIIKSAFSFSERFWKAENFSMITDTLPHYIFHTTQNQSGTSGMLTSYTIGDKAPVFAKLSQAQKIQEICQALKPAFGNIEKYAEKNISYYWGNDPFSQGAYANYDVGQWFGLREMVAKPFKNTVFAGEHIADWQGFMEGAFETGILAAKALT
ncbi:MAG: FAD-dependent oxidoreductase [Verrucomicrobia bacterium]|nr:FAD-dependent oxidoreductase [Cytophagales bacterium]